MLSSAAFAGSARCQEFLRYVVEHKLDHDEQSIKERVIAADVFGRTSYEPGEDSFVRVKASEVRRRLSRFYETAAPDAGGVRIELPVGQYVPRFVLVPPAPAPAEEAPLTPPAVSSEAVHPVGPWSARRTGDTGIDRAGGPQRLPEFV